MSKLVKRACDQAVAVKSLIDNVIARGNGMLPQQGAQRIVNDVLVRELTDFYEMGFRPGELRNMIHDRVNSSVSNPRDFIDMMVYNTCLLRVVAGYSGYSNIHLVPRERLSFRDFRSFTFNSPAFIGDERELNSDLECLVAVHCDMDGEFNLFNLIDMVKYHLGPDVDNRYLSLVYERDLIGRYHSTNFNGSPSRESDHVNKWSWNDDGDKWTFDSAEDINQTRMEKVNPTKKEHEEVQSEKPTLTDSPVGTATKVDITAKHDSNPSKAQATAFGIGGAQGAKVNGNVSCEYHIDSLEVHGHGKKLKIKGLNGKLTANVDTLVEVLGALGIKE